MKLKHPRGTLQLTAATDLKDNTIHENNLSLSLEDIWICRRVFEVSLCLNLLLSKITDSLSPWKESVVPLIENDIEINTVLHILSGCIPFGLRSFHLPRFRKECKHILKFKKKNKSLTLSDLRVSKKDWGTNKRAKKCTSYRAAQEIMTDNK